MKKEEMLQKVALHNHLVFLEQSGKAGEKALLQWLMEQTREDLIWVAYANFMKLIEKGIKPENPLIKEMPVEIEVEGEN